MSRNKKILFITNGPVITASSRTRVYAYKGYIEKAGFRAAIIPYNIFIEGLSNAMENRRNLIVRVLNKINQFFKCVFYILIAPVYDIIYLQRALLPKTVFKCIRVLCPRVIFDFDDAIYMADRWSVPFLIKDRFLKRFQYILKNADCVVVSNGALQKIASEFNSRVLILPTPVDTQKLTPRAVASNNGSVTVGWIGSPPTTRYITPLSETLDLLIKKYPFLKIELVGAASLPGVDKHIAIKKWSINNEASDLQKFDIGIMPLDEDEWSAGKGGYKLFQYMAVGIPCVASPVGINKDIIDEGITGFFAKNPAEWLEKLSLLINDRELRNRMGAAGRKKAEEIYSYNVNISKMISVLNNV